MLVPDFFFSSGSLVALTQWMGIDQSMMKKNINSSILCVQYHGPIESGLDTDSGLTVAIYTSQS